MQRLTIFLLTTAITIGLLNACGPSEEEQRQREQARQDSLEQVRQQELAQQKRDSIAQARRDSIAAAQESEPEPIQFEFSSNGAYSVHVGSWRSEEKAQAQVQTWKDRGFDNASVSKFGEEETGNVWFRVRLGRVENREMAQKLQDEIQNEFDAQSWVALNQ